MINKQAVKNTGTAIHRNNLIYNVIKDVKVNKVVYLMLIPVLLYYMLFYYKPMYGAVIAFKDFRPALGVTGSPWVGFQHFKDFFGSVHFLRVLKNTILISLYDLALGFPAPIILALLLNEVKSIVLKKSVQTITYMPHFISMVVICGMIKDFTASTGIINDIIAYFGGERVSLLMRPQYFRMIYVISSIWQHVGWSTIIYLAALTNVDTEQYEAAVIDGANRWKQMIYITLPGILPTIIILLILRLGQVLNVGFEKVLLLYNPAIYDTADVISTFVYRKGLQELSFSYGSAVGLFNSVVSFFMVIFSNWFSRKVTETSLW